MSKQLPVTVERPMADAAVKPNLRQATDSLRLARASARFLEGGSAGAPKEQAEIVRAWVDGSSVFLHAVHRPREGEQARVTTAFYDTDEDGELTEHWEVVSELRGPNPSGRTQLDGATHITDLEYTEQNKALVKSMLEECLFPGARPERIEDYFAEEYLQHNPNVGDGLAIVRKLAQGAQRQLTYEAIVRLVGRGNFVAALCKANWEGAPLSQVDILRVEDGKIVEHWDNSQPAPE